MCNSKPNLWPRHTWTGADVAVDERARIEAVHGLLTATYPRMLIAFARPSGQPQPREAPGTLSGAWHREEGGEGLKQEENLRTWAPLTKQRQQQTRHCLRAGALPNTPRKGERQLAGLQLSHLDTSYMQPLTLMLHSHLDISSERWEVQQRVAVGTRGDLNLSGSGCGRQFMMTEAAFARVEAKYMERLADLWNSPEQWTTIPPQCLTGQFRALCLRVLARQGAAVEQLLAHPRRQFPFALFQLLETPEEASNMVTIPECRKDTWTLAVQKQYPARRRFLGNTNSACAPPKH